MHMCPIKILIVKSGSDFCTPYFRKMGGENMGVGGAAIFGSDFHKSAMNSWQEGRDDKSGVALTTLLAHQLYKTFLGGKFSRVQNNEACKRGQVCPCRMSL